MPRLGDPNGRFLGQAEFNAIHNAVPGLVNSKVGGPGLNPGNLTYGQLIKQNQQQNGQPTDDKTIRDIAEQQLLLAANTALNPKEAVPVSMTQNRPGYDLTMLSKIQLNQLQKSLGTFQENGVTYKYFTRGKPSPADALLEKNRGIWDPNTDNSTFFQRLAQNSGTLVTAAAGLIAGRGIAARNTSTGNSGGTSPLPSWTAKLPAGPYEGSFPKWQQSQTWNNEPLSNVGRPVGNTAPLTPRVDVTSDFTVKSLGGGITRFQYGDPDGVQGLVLDLDSDGVLGANIRAKLPSDRMDWDPSGTDMFLSGMNKIQQEGLTVNQIRGYWLGRSDALTNYNEFMSNLNELGMNEFDAAANTWTGRISANLGYGKVVSVTQDSQTVTAIFGR
jgi:hypothetical protein